jgi:hypothetical protein
MSTWRTRRPQKVAANFQRNSGIWKAARRDEINNLPHVAPRVRVAMQTPGIADDRMTEKQHVLHALGRTKSVNTHFYFPAVVRNMSSASAGHHFTEIASLPSLN